MNQSELLLYLLIVFAAIIPAAIYARRRFRHAVVVTIIVGVVCVGGAILGPTADLDAWRPERLLPVQTTDQGYTSSDTCRSCHPGNYASWHDSYHRTMTQVASTESIKAPFDGAVLTSRGRNYRAFRVGEEFRVDMPDPDWEVAMQKRGTLDQFRETPRVTRRIVLVTGSHHYQVYWVASVRGRELRQFPWAYHLQEQRWIPSEDVFIRPPDGPRRFALWNNNCIQCHSTAGNPRIDPTSKDLNSSVAEFGISCEACHGPSAEHVRHHRNPTARYRQRLKGGPDPTIVNPKRLSARKSSAVCGQCHSNFAPVDVDDWFRHGYSFRPGDELEKSHDLMKFQEMGEGEFHSAAFWKDGTSRVGGREYMAMTESACHIDGDLSCLSCHSMHDSDPNDQLASNMEGNQACLQCHATMADKIESHSNHAAGSAGSQCYNCHMPHTTYALFKGIRSHRIDSPSVANSVKTGRPNACNLCHADKTLRWTADHLSSWYGTAPPALTNDQESISAMLLWLLQGDAVQRAVAAWNLGWEASRQAAGDGWQAPFLIHLLNDPYAAVRFVAYDALRKFPGYEDFKYDFVGPLAERQAAKQPALGRWNPAENARRGEPILIDQEGNFLHDKIHQLMEKRDDTPIELPE